MHAVAQQICKARGFTDDSAALNKIGTSGFTIDLSAGVTIYDVFMISSGLSLVVPSDEAPFHQDVVEGDGDPYSAKSTVIVMPYSLAAGVRTPFWALGANDHGWIGGALFAMLGSAGVSGSRGIGNCSDCWSDTLELTGGTFWRVGLDIAAPARKAGTAYGATLSYQGYFASSAIASAASIAFSMWF